MNPNDQSDVVDGQDLTSRRNVLIGGASLAAMAWAAPGMTRLSVAYAEGTLCEESDVSPDVPYDAVGGPNSVTLDPGSYRVDVWGGGGGGWVGDNSAGGGGGGGGYTSATFNVSTCTTYSFTATVGTGGSAATAGGESRCEPSGATPLPVSLLTAGGGQPGTTSLGGAGGTGGTQGLAGNPPSGNTGGSGGAGGGPGGGAGGPATQSGSAPGGGGGGKNNGAQSPGGSGGNGRVRITVL